MAGVHEDPSMLHYTMEPDTSNSLLGGHRAAAAAAYSECSSSVRTLSKGHLVGQKPTHWFGYYPVWSECVPLQRKTERIDWAEVAANIGNGLVIGLREALGGIVSASLVFSSSGVGELAGLFPLGIAMMWYSTAVGSLWYSFFGRLQYGYTIAQDIVGILQAQMAAKAVYRLRLIPGGDAMIPATVLSIIALSALLCGGASVLIGKLGLGKYMMLFPKPVTSGFLGSIGFVILRSSLQTSSGVNFHYFYPVDFAKFTASSSLAQLGLQVATVVCIRCGPSLVARCLPGKASLEKLGGLVCQLLPVALFYIIIASAGISMEDLTAAGWTYPSVGGSSASSLLFSYRVADAHIPTVLASAPDMVTLVLMAVLCTMTGVLAITDRFPKGPHGDPSPMESVDFDRELCTVGVCDLILGLTGGTLTFHTFTAIQLRLDGGTHRVAVLSVAAAVGGAFLSGAPIGRFVPKWYLSGLFMNTAIHFMKSAIMSYESLPGGYLSWQYAISMSAMTVSVFASPDKAIFVGLVLSVGLFLVQSCKSSPVSNVCGGNQVVSRTMRPFWELRILRQEGDRICLLYLQGNLFFGSARRLVAMLDAILRQRVNLEYLILSFAKVQHIDPSAAKTLKSAADRARQHGCRVIVCRMRQEIYSTLEAAELIEAPDQNLVDTLLGLKWRTSGPTQPRRLPLASPLASPLHSPKATPPSQRSRSQLGLGLNLGLDDLASPRAAKTRATWGLEYDAAGGPTPPNAFAHETDALDYCDEVLLRKHLYHRLGVPLEGYMMAYREAASVPGVRLEEWAFEQMNGLPAGCLGRIKPFCEIQERQEKERIEGDGALCFIMRGAISMVQMISRADDLETIDASVGRGFSFRKGKRLLKRLPPGNVFGKQNFFLRQRDRVIDATLDPEAIVSSKLGGAVEIWVLRPQMWPKLPEDEKAALTMMLCVQMAAAEVHMRLQER